MKKLNTLNEAMSYILSIAQDEQKRGVPDFKIAAPLGLGKANQLLNLIYEKFKKSQDHQKLEIYTALSLDVPDPQSSLEKKLLKPFLERHFGKDYPRLNYVEDLLKNKMPDHIKVHEFYFLAGQFLSNSKAQQDYISLNYTHAARSISQRGLQVLIQLIAKSDRFPSQPYSLSCNPDMTLDLVDMYKDRNKKLFVIGVVHPDLPYLGGDAAVSENFFDAVLESSEISHQLFALPRNPVDKIDQMIGFHASQMVQDEGTLQIGIGSLSDSIVNWMIQRHQKNSQYQSQVHDFWSTREKPMMLHTAIFEKGLYGTSEMVMDGFMHLRKSGILKRFIFDQDEKKRRYLHGAFFLGSKELYQWLRNLKGEDFEGLSMTRVSKVNDLYDVHEMSLRHQRKNARFFNTCMQVDLLGGACSDTLPNAQVVSGVGGQYNFVSMSQEMNDSHSILMLRSTRTKNGHRVSNIVPLLGQTTIPRHLRDIVITEYGVACLQGKSDSEVIQSLIAISDSQFQPDLIKWAQKNKKLSKNYKIPVGAQNNTPQMLEKFIHKHKTDLFFCETPFGLDFDEVEYKLIKALTAFKTQPKWKTFICMISSIFISKYKYQIELERLDLFRTVRIKDFFERLIVISALSQKNKE